MWASGFLAAAQDALGFALRPEPHHMGRLRVLVGGEVVPGPHPTT